MAQRNIIKKEDGDEPADLASEYEGKYWTTSVFITGYGQVNGGKATKEQLEAFIGKMNPDTNLDDWLSDKDVYSEYIKKNTTKSKPS